MNDSWVGAASLYPTGSCLRKTTRAIEVGGLLAWVCIHASLCSAGVSRLLCLLPYCTSPADSCQDQMYHFDFFWSRESCAHHGPTFATLKSDNQSVSSASLISFSPSASISLSSVPIALKFATNARETMGLGHSAIRRGFCTTTTPSKWHDTVT